MGFFGSAADAAIYDRYGDSDAVDAYNDAFKEGGNDVIGYLMDNSEPDFAFSSDDDGYGETLEQARIDGYSAGVSVKFSELGFSEGDYSDRFGEWLISRHGS